MVCQFTGEGPTLADFITVKDVYPVGRLDKDSEGLLLLTSDGRLQHRLTDPRYAHKRTYWVQVDGVPDEAALQTLTSGMEIRTKGEIYRTLPAKAGLLPEPPPVAERVPPIRVRQSIPTSWLEMTLKEGKNRQIRHMTAGVGYPTLRLIRVASGDLRLGDLPAGQWRDASPGEQRLLRKEAGLG